MRIEAFLRRKKSKISTDSKEKNHLRPSILARRSITVAVMFIF
jgi:hypothetical protein